MLLVLDSTLSLLLLRPIDGIGAYSPSLLQRAPTHRSTPFVRLEVIVTPDEVFPFPLGLTDDCHNLLPEPEPRRDLI